MTLDTPSFRSNNSLVADIVIQRLSKSFPAARRKEAPLCAIAEISLNISAGELVTLVGPSGSGKTTLLRLIAGLEEPDAGTITIAGRDQARVPVGERDVAMVFQTLALYPHMTSHQNMAFGLKLRGIAAGDIAARIGDTAGRLGLDGCLLRRPAELSGGQRQRVALGRALVRQPKVLLLDEPFANLDAPLRRELRRDLQRLHRELGLTILLVTHDETEALALGQRVAVLNAGKLEQFSPPTELRTAPASPFVATFLDERVI
jgi:multiple sugar transport system ATP-binding protein